MLTASTTLQEVGLLVFALMMRGGTKIVFSSDGISWIADWVTQMVEGSENHKLL